MSDPSKFVKKQGDHIVIPGFATAHSHAFQRALRGRTQRRATEAGSFWSWRGLMYSLVEKLEPEDIFNISRFAFVELLMSGVTAVGEFHYVHHQPDGTPYDDRILLADTVIRAAREAGIRITLIRTAYLQAGYSQDLEPAQKRFCDPSVDEILKDVETLQDRFKEDPYVGVALAAHSIRAVPIAQVQELAAYAKKNQMPFHMHVSEQRREVEECLQQYGKRPVELLSDAGVLGENFVAVHATHLDDHEIKAMGDAGCTICLCRTTERDLGDGLPQTSELIEAGVKICVGVDSHASSDAFEEIRAVELDERSRTEARTVAAEAPELMRMATIHGLEAIGMPNCSKNDQVHLAEMDPSLTHTYGDLWPDIVIFGAQPRAVNHVIVDEQLIVDEGTHLRYMEAHTGYSKSLQKIDLV
ncbi:formimidoylglutamate deiminase [bacterium]|nr:formimidoylglutamate deiminase [bacterium]